MYKPKYPEFVEAAFKSFNITFCPEAFDKIFETDTAEISYDKKTKNSRFPEEFPRNKIKGLIRLAAEERFRGQRGKRSRGDDSRTIKTNNVKSLYRHSPSNSMIITSGIEEFYQGTQII